MRARTLGAALMITLGSVAMVSPLGGTTGTAGVQDPCQESGAAAPIDPCAPCDTAGVAGAPIDPCVVDTVPTDTTPVDTTPAGTAPADDTPESGLPGTGRDSAPLAIGAGALLVVGGLALLASRRRGAPVTPR